jgi:two-component system chemotaxis response regulator CheY
MAQTDVPDLKVIYRRRYGELMQEKQRLSSAMEKLARKLKTHEEESLMSKRILLVDDAAFMRMMLKDILEKNGFDVVGEAEDGEAGVEKYKQLNPDLVVLNITMPKMDGIDALSKIREHYPTARAVMCSAMGFAAIVGKALMAGAKRFMVKPFQPDKLINDIKTTLLEDPVGENTFNRVLLTKILESADANRNVPNGKEILSQAQIDEIIRLAEIPNATPEDMDELMNRLFLASDFNAIAALRATTSADPVLSMLEKLAHGQEKMTLLLERLLKAQEGQ